MAKAKDIPGLDCGAGVSDGARLILTTRLAEMCALREAALDWSDPEGVHDMRVAARRLRRAAQDFRAFVPKRRLRPLIKGVRHFAGLLGEVRDADVAIIALTKIAAKAPPEIAAGVAGLSRERVRRREGARARLEQELTDETLSELRAEVEAALRAPEAPGAQEQEGGEERAAAQPEPHLREAGAEIVRKRVYDLRKASVSLFSPLAAEPLHRLRILSKRLRYALELFAPCLDAKLGGFAAEVAAMQNSLGELHDCDVWIEGLGGRLTKRGKRPEPAQGHAENSHGLERRACMWLLRHFAKERSRHYREALARWHAWENYELLEHLLALLGPPRADAQPAAPVTLAAPDQADTREEVAS